MTTDPHSMRDGLRLALGTFTIVPVPPPATVGRRQAAVAMLAAPWIGGLIGLVAAAAGVVVATWSSPLLAAVAIVGVLAVLTRGLHLDGLADTADGLGSGRRGAEALAIMRRSDIGPFGVVTIVLVLLADVAALASIDRDDLWFVVPLAVAAGRAGAMLACVRGVPAADQAGLGAAVAGTVPRSAAAVTVLAMIAIGAVTLDAAGALMTGVALIVAALIVARCVSRLGGINGDVLGATIACCTLAAFVTAALAR